MKKFFALFILLIIGTAMLTGQNVYIPDNNFKERLIILGVDLDGDGEISFDEAAVPESLNISPEYGLYVIEDITGMEAFINLDTLICSDNNISSLEPIKFLMLKYLDCSNNFIADIDFPMLVLEFLHCHNNELTELHAVLFPTLKILKCNPTQSLIISNSALEELIVTSNIPVDVTEAPELIRLDCKPNSPPDLTNNTNLEYLRIDSQPEQVTQIDLSGNPNLDYLFINADLFSIDLTNNPALTEIDLRQNFLSSLDLSGNPNLETLICFSNQLESLDLSGNPLLVSVLCQQNSLTGLNLSGLTNLETLICLYNQLTQIDLLDNTAIENLYICHNQFTQVDVTMNPNLEIFYCLNNQISGTIDLSGNPALKKLDCSQNQLDSLDLSHNLLLEELWCQENTLSYINVNGLTELQDLHFFQNQIEAIDLSTNTALSFMQCGFNPADSLDLSYNLNLETVHFTEMPDLGKVCVSMLPVPFEYTADGTPGIFFEQCTFTDIAELPEEDYTVYPNPTSGPITLVSQSGRFSKIQILNSLGDVQQEVTVTAPVQSVDLTGFPAGLYFLRISGASEQMVEKVILQ